MEQNCVSRQDLVIVGRVGSAFGLAGWVKINSFTEPKSNIWSFKNWFLINNNLVVLKNKVKEFRKNYLVLFADVLDRTSAAQLTNNIIAVNRSDLPKLQASQYYWVDLIGSKVYNLSNCLLGCLDHIFITAANDVMVIRNTTNGKRIEHLVPYSLGDIVIKVDLENKIIIVNWEVN